MEFDYSKVADYCSEINSISKNMQRYLDNIKKSIKSVNSNWSGSAANKFMSKSSKLSLEFEKYQTELNACILFMKKSSSNYKNVDKNIKKVIDGALSSSTFFK